MLEHEGQPQAVEVIDSDRLTVRRIPFHDIKPYLTRTNNESSTTLPGELILQDLTAINECNQSPHIPERQLTCSQSSQSTASAIEPPNTLSNSFSATPQEAALPHTPVQEVASPITLVQEVASPVTPVQEVASPINTINTNELNQIIDAEEAQPTNRPEIANSSGEPTLADFSHQMLDERSEIASSRGEPTLRNTDNSEPNQRDGLAPETFTAWMPPNLNLTDRVPPLTMEARSQSSETDTSGSQHNLVSDRRLAVPLLSNSIQADRKSVV